MLQSYSVAKPEHMTLIWLARRISQPTEMQAKKYHLYRLGMRYWQYTKAPHWVNFRKQYIKTHGTQCELSKCSNLGKILHHRTYYNLGHETFEDVALVCVNCHNKIHDLARRLSGRGRKKNRIHKTPESSNDAHIWSREYIPRHTLGDARFIKP